MAIECPYCKKADLKYIEELDWEADYYICPNCDSTYTPQAVEDPWQEQL